MSVFPAVRTDIEWERLGLIDLASPAASITFAFAGSIYRNFRLLCNIEKDGTPSAIGLQCNGDSNANYSRTSFRMHSSTPVTNTVTGQDRVATLAAVGASDRQTIEFMIAKVIATQEATIGAESSVQSDGDGDAGIQWEILAGEWTNVTELLESLTVLATSGNFAVGSQFMLEGSKFVADVESG